MKMRRLGYAGIAVVLIAAIAFVAGRRYLASAEARATGQVTLPALDAPVEVWRDSMGVPHVFARSEQDLARAIGFLHARERLWQMEFFRRVADGRLAEILGEQLIESDRFLRTLGLGRAAGENLAILDPDSREILQAYADGVNAWISNREGALPPEFIALRFEPEPWTPRNSAAIAKIMAWDLAEWEQELNLQRASDHLSDEHLRELIPAYPEWGPVIVGGDASATESAHVSSLESCGAEDGTTRLPSLPPLTRTILESVSIARGSNSWVAGGAMSASGMPILANDPHLTLRAPSLWYLAALHGGPTSVAGVTIPGTPFVVIGRTPGVAWSMTNAMVDDVDFFIERLDPQDSTRYRTRDGWSELVVRPETIQVRRGAPVVHRVRSSRHGPIFSDIEPRAGDRVLAMRWTAHEPSTVLVALQQMNRARSADELISGLRSFDEAHQNVLFADRAGRFGFWMVGRVPVRASGTGTLPTPGWTGEGDWVRYLDFDEHPRQLEPREPFIVTANNRQIGQGYPFHLGTGWAEPFRAVRIREMLTGATALTIGDVARQQMDVRDAFALRFLPHALRAAEAAGDSAALKELQAWNGEATIASRGAALFYLWYEQLRVLTGADEYRGEAMYFPRETLNRILEAGDNVWVDDVRTPERESLSTLSTAAFVDATRIAAGRPWGDLHSTRMDHALGASQALDRVLGLNVGPFPSPGSPFTVNVAGYGARPPFVNTHGASMRQVIDLGDPGDGGWWILATGQSGLPFSARYSDQTSLWRSGRLWYVPLDRELAGARIIERLLLQPATADRP